MAEVEAPQIDTSVKKKFMFVNRKAPYGTIYALEALEVVLISAAFEQDVSLAFPRRWGLRAHQGPGSPPASA